MIFYWLCVFRRSFLLGGPFLSSSNASVDRCRCRSAGGILVVPQTYDEELGICDGIAVIIGF